MSILDLVEDKEKCIDRFEQLFQDNANEIMYGTFHKIDKDHHNSKILHDFVLYMNTIHDRLSEVLNGEEKKKGNFIEEIKTNRGGTSNAEIKSPIQKILGNSEIDIADMQHLKKLGVEEKALASVLKIWEDIPDHEDHMKFFIPQVAAFLSASVDSSKSQENETGSMKQADLAMITEATAKHVKELGSEVALKEAEQEFMAISYKKLEGDKIAKGYIKLYEASLELNILKGVSPAEDQHVREN